MGIAQAQDLGDDTAAEGRALGMGNDRYDIDAVVVTSNPAVRWDDGNPEVGR